MQPPSFQNLVDDFLLDKELSTAPATQRYYRTTLERFAAVAGVGTLADFNPSVIKAFLSGLLARGLSPATADNYRRSLLVFCTWLYTRKYTEDNLIRQVPKLPRRALAQKAKHISVFDKSQLRLILEQARKGHHAHRDVALIYLLLDTGMRIGEVCKLEVPNILWQENTLITHGKTGLHRAYMSPKTKYKLRVYINRYRRAIQREQAVFVTQDGKPIKPGVIGGHLRRLAMKAGVEGPKLGPHTYRHTFAVNYIKNGGDAFSLRDILGHSTLKMTDTYVQLARQDVQAHHARYSPGQTLLD